MDISQGDVLKVSSGIIVHGCNAQGVMGSGIAKSVKEDFPAVFAAYRDRYEKTGLSVGTVIPVQVADDKWIVNAITQKFYGRDGRRYVDYEGVRKCFSQIRTLAVEKSLPVFYPLIGCDLGGGDWGVVSQIIDEELHDVRHGLFLLPGKTIPPSRDFDRPVASSPPSFSPRKAFGR